jgi:hypothetical protein
MNRGSGLANKAFPDGIGASHRQAQSPLAALLRWWLLLAIGLVLVAAFSGIFGGGRPSATTATGPEATLRVEAPAVVRNGETFEVRFSVEAHRAIARPVIGIAERYWREITINTTAPTPAVETFADGYLLFELEPIDSGGSARFKIDAQVNPARLGASEGFVAVRDGERILARAPISLTVLP